MSELTKHAFRVPKGNKQSDPYRDADTLCNSCLVLDYGMCPNLIALHDSGHIDPPIKKCHWKEFFDKTAVLMKEQARNSANGTIRKQKKESLDVPHNVSYTVH